MNQVLEILGNTFIILGALLFASGALGLLRFPDAYTRVSSVGTAGGIGIILVIAGTVLLTPSVSTVVKATIVVALQLATSAIGSIAIARSAYLTGVPLYEQHFNDLDTDGHVTHDGETDRYEEDIDSTNSAEPVDSADSADGAKGAPQRHEPHQNPHSTT